MDCPRGPLERIVGRQRDIHTAALKITGLKTGVLCYPRQHTRPHFLAIVKREDVVRPALSGKSAV
jgi:hypothetical protein